MRVDTCAVTPSSSLWPFADKWAMQQSSNLSVSSGAAIIRRGDVSILPLTGSGSHVAEPRGTATHAEFWTSGKPSVGSHQLHFRRGRQEDHPLNLWSVFERRYPLRTLLLGSFPRGMQGRIKQIWEMFVFQVRTGGFLFIRLFVFAWVSHVRFKQRLQIRFQ